MALLFYYLMNCTLLFLCYLLLNITRYYAVQYSFFWRTMFIFMVFKNKNNNIHLKFYK